MLSIEACSVEDEIGEVGNCMLLNIEYWREAVRLNNHLEAASKFICLKKCKLLEVLAAV